MLLAPSKKCCFFGVCVCDLPRSSVVREKEIFYKKLGREKGNLNPLNSVLRFSSIESDAGHNPALTAQRDITAAGSRHKIRQTRNSPVSRQGRKQPKSPPPSILMVCPCKVHALN
uniref:Uncharacterized protein n=3 Tax=Micrurus TaxID=8634 RepID=A0A2D4G0M8_MICCO